MIWSPVSYLAERFKLHNSAHFEQLPCLSWSINITETYRHIQVYSCIGKALLLPSHKAHGAVATVVYLFRVRDASNQTRLTVSERRGILRQMYESVWILVLKLSLTQRISDMTVLQFALGGLKCNIGMQQIAMFWCFDVFKTFWIIRTSALSSR